MNRKLGVGVALAAVLLLSAGAAADPTSPAPAPAVPSAPAPDPAPPALPGPVHFHSAFAYTTDGGATGREPPGWFLDEPGFAKLNGGLKDCQNSNTSLTAQNNSLQGTLSGWTPGWKSLAMTLVTGVALGWYLHDKF